MTSNNQLPPMGDLNWAQLAALIEASNLLNATLDHDEVLRQLMSLAAKGVDAHRATLYLLDEEGRELRSIVLLEEGLREIRISVEAGLAGYVARTGKPVSVADAYADPRFNPQIDQEFGYRTRTVLAVPLHDTRGQLCGVVQVLNKRQGLFSPEDELYLRALAEQAALALENARHHASMLANCQRLNVLYRINSLMIGEVDLPTILHTVIEAAIESLDAEAGSVLLWDQQRQRLSFVTTSGVKSESLKDLEVPVEGSIAGWVFHQGQAATVNDAQNDPRFFAGVDECTGFVTHSLVCAPLTVRGKTVGVLEILNRRSGFFFADSDQQFLQAVANFTALAIESVGDYESLLAL